MGSAQVVGVIPPRAPNDSSKPKPELAPLPLPDAAKGWPGPGSPFTPCANDSAGDQPGSPVSPPPLANSTVADDVLVAPHLVAGYADEPNPAFRPTMEDAVTMTVLPSGGVFLGVYDGHGGDFAALHASQALHQHFEAELAITGDPESAFHTAYARVDHTLREHRARTVGATAVTAHCTADTLTVANAGDSRAVLGCVDGKSIRLTVDHRPTLPSERDRVRRSGAFVCSGRVNGTLAVSRALGDHALKSAVICQPHVSITTLQPEHRFLIVGCDGLWDVVEDDEAVAFVNALLNDRTWARRPTPLQLADALVQRAMDKGTTDNVSVVVAILTGLDASI